MAEIKKYLDTTALGTLVTQIKAEDAKTLQSAKDYCDSKDKLFETAGAANTALESAKSYTDELANGAVKTNTEAIATLNGDATTEGSVKKAVADAKSEIQTLIDGVDDKADKNAEDIAAINNAETGILKQAKDYADAEDAKVEQEVADLETYVGTFTHATAKTVVEYINAKTDGIATSGNLEALGARVTSVEGDVATIKGDYLKAADKTALEGKITAEETARTQADEGLSARIKAVEDDYLKSADKTELTNAIATAKQEAIATVLGEGVDADFDTLKEVADWILSDTTGAAALQTDVATLKEEMDAVEADVEQAQKDIDAVEAAVATKAEAQALTDAITTLEGVDAGQETRIAALEAKFGEGEGNVEDMISDAVADGIADAVAQAEAKDAALETALKKYVDEEDAKIEGTIATLTETVNGKAAQSEVNTISGKVGTLETDMAQAKTDIDAVEVKAAANETAIGTINTELAKKAAQTDLNDAIARIAANETAIAGKASDADLDDAVERIAANETAIASHADLIAANTSAINSFTAITSAEVEALFA